MTARDRLRVLVVDDEPPARDAMGVLLAQHPDLQLVASCGDGWAAVEAIRSQHPDIVFLDVQMPGLDGLGVVREIGPNAMPVTIFVTAYEEHALAAFDLAAVDYLLKPFGDARFERSLARARVAARERHGSTAVEQLAAVLAATGSTSDTVVVRDRGRITFLRADEIDYVEAADDYVRIYAAGEVHLLREPLSRLADRLEPAGFIRVHRSTILNGARLRALESGPHGDYVAVLRDGARLRVSRRFWEGLAGRLGV